MCCWHTSDCGVSRKNVGWRAAFLPVLTKHSTDEAKLADSSQPNLNSEFPWQPAPDWWGYGLCIPLASRPEASEAQNAIHRLCVT